ncbi:MAG: hypothetical protein LRS49_02055 [Desulfurococcales archaeon]|nr:hypothetical protein [Desulfurococcales archaeon]
MEEPTEPPEPCASENCVVRVYGGAGAAEALSLMARKAVYSYNLAIRGTSYYLKPVHYVYKRGNDGVTKVYEYYGRYWWRLERRGSRVRWRYVGRRKPPGLPEPPRTGLEGLRIIRVGDDIIVDCWVLEKFPDLFRGLRLERVY